MPWRALPAAIALSLVCVLPGCGGSGRLSASDYRARLATAGKDAAKAQGEVEKAFQAKTVAELVARVKAFAASEDKLGDEVGRLKAPKDAESANAELARGEHDTATEIRTLLPKLSTYPSPKAAIAFLNRHAPKGGREIDHALAQLKKLGYTKGS